MNNNNKNILLRSFVAAASYEEELVGGRHSARPLTSIATLNGGVIVVGGWSGALLSCANKKSRSLSLANDWIMAIAAPRDGGDVRLRTLVAVATRNSKVTLVRVADATAAPVALCSIDLVKYDFARGVALAADATRLICACNSGVCLLSREDNEMLYWVCFVFVEST